MLLLLILLLLLSLFLLDSNVTGIAADKQEVQSDCLDTQTPKQKAIFQLLLGFTEASIFFFYPSHNSVVYSLTYSLVWYNLNQNLGIIPFESFYKTKNVAETK